MNKTLLEQAQQLQQQNQNKEALDIYLQLLKEEPKEAELNHVVGILYAQLGDEEEGLKYIARAIRINSQVSAFYNSKGNILLRKNALKEANKAYQKAIKLDPSYAIAYTNLGRSFYLQGQFISAQKAYLKALELDPRLANAHYNYAILLSQLGQFDDAIIELDKTVDLNARFAPAYGQLAEIYLQQKNYRKAIDYYKKRLKLTPQNAEAMYHLGIALLESGDVQQAIYAFEETLILQPHHPECHHHLASAYIHYGDSEKALNYYLRQLSISPKPESYYNIGVLFMQKNRNKEAIIYFKNAARLEPNYLPTYLNLGAIYLKLNQTAEAIHAYKNALTIKPEDPEIQHILAALEQPAATPQQAPTQYIENLFNQYATYYDKHLTEHLDYKVPQKIYQAIFEEVGIETAEWNILDLGCGTGLTGALFKKLAKRLIGIDVSENMIQLAKQKNIYDELTILDADKALEKYQHLDLILAADVFTYIGKLDDIFAKGKRALNPDGLFVFTVEKTTVNPYVLQKTIRYAHSKTYLDQLIQQFDFKLLKFVNIVLRMQKKQPIEGYLIILQKKELDSALELP